MTAAEAAAEPRVPAWRRLFEYLDWKINPVLLRDLRLYMRGRMMLTAYFLTLAALVMLAVLYALSALVEEEDGRMLLRILVYIMAIATGAFIPNLVYERFRSELANRATELALMSQLTPARLVRGKLTGAWCVSMIVVATASPMLATAYLLGGVTVEAIIGLVAGVSVAAAVMPTLQLFLATQRNIKGLSRSLVSLAFIFQLVLMSVYATFLVEMFFEEISYPSPFLHYHLLSYVGFAVLCAQFLYFATVGRLRSEAENRDFAPRLSLMAATLLCGGPGGIIIGMFMPLLYPLGRLVTMPFSFFVGTVLILSPLLFCVGFIIVSRTSPTPPRNAAAGRWWPLRSLFLPGFKSLSRFFLVNCVIMLGCFGAGLIFPETPGRSIWGPFDFHLSLLMAVLQGLLVYYYIVLPFAKNKRSPSLLPTTIILYNLIMGILSTFVLVLSDVVAGFAQLHWFVSAITPVGLLTASAQSFDEAYEAGNMGIKAMGLLLVLLLPACFDGKKAKIVGMDAADAA